MDNAIPLNKLQLIVIKSKEPLFVMIVIPLVMLVQISYLQNAHNVKMAFTYGKEHANLHVLNQLTNMN